MNSVQNRLAPVPPGDKPTCPTCKKPMAKTFSRLTHHWLFYCYNCISLYRVVDGRLVSVMVWRVEQCHTGVQGLQGVAGLFPATSREQDGNKGSEVGEIHVLTPPPYSGGSGETQHNPANPAGVDSGVEWVHDIFPAPQVPPPTTGEGAA